MRAYIFNILVFASFASYAQTFEGKITYQNTYTSKISDVTSEQLIAMMGTTQEYYVKGGVYKSVMNGSFSQWQLYVPSENRLYSKMAMSDTLLWNDGGIRTDEIVSYEILKDQISVLGYRCDALVVTTKTDKTTYYYNSELKVDAELYTNHKFGNWDFLVAKTKSLALRLDIETPMFSMVGIATEVKEMKLEDSFFNLPDLPSKKSRY